MEGDRHETRTPTHSSAAAGSASTMVKHVWSGQPTALLQSTSRPQKWRGRGTESRAWWYRRPLARLCRRSGSDLRSTHSSGDRT